MSDIYAIAAIGLAEGRQRLETIGLNAASASQPGYRRQIAVGAPFALQLADSLSASAEAHAPIRTTAEVAVGRHVDVRAGPLVSTGRALDLAIEGDGLYFALTDGTQTWLTRSGSLRLDAEGALIGERGLRVAGTQGDIRPGSAELEVQRDGQLLREGVVVGALQLFRADDPAALRSAGGALLTSSAGHHGVEAGVGRIRSGFVEGSNVNTADDMVGLIALSRQFESLVRVTQNYDELLGRTIQKLGEA